jgi:signal transduction histidine kinase
VQGDTIRLSEIFQNLIVNGLKYNEQPEKQIIIGSGSEGNNEEVPEGYELLWVKDNGIGISPEHFEVVFTIFRRLHGRNEYGGGTGIGLTIVKKIIERHGGSLWIESEVGEGTTFFFTLPSING